MSLDSDADGRRSADFIDVRYYVLILAAWWQEMVLALLIVAGAGALLQSWRGPLYEAAVDLDIGDAIGAVERVDGSPGLLMAMGPSQESERRAKVAMLLGLVHQPGLAEKVWLRMEGRLGGVSASSLLARVGADLVTFSDREISDLIRITTTGSTPQQAADLAAAWAEEYVARVNHLLRDDDRLGAVDETIAAALLAGEQGQQRLETFMAQSNLAALERRLAANDQAVQALWQVRNETIVTAAGGKPQSIPPTSIRPDAKTGLGAIEEIEAESRALAVEIAAAANTLALLTQERDAGRVFAQALRDEVAALRARDAVWPERVRLASMGSVFAQKASPSVYRVAVVAAAAATPAVIVLVLFANAMGVSPLLGVLGRRRR